MDEGQVSGFVNKLQSTFRTNKSILKITGHQTAATIDTPLSKQLATNLCFDMSTVLLLVLTLLQNEMQF